MGVSSRLFLWNTTSSLRAEIAEIENAVVVEECLENSRKKNELPNCSFAAKILKSRSDVKRVMAMFISRQQNLANVNVATRYIPLLCAKTAEAAESR